MSTSKAVAASKGVAIKVGVPMQRVVGRVWAALVAAIDMLVAGFQSNITKEAETLL
jgi:hypothetical protein